MNPMTDERRRDNLAWWTSLKLQYPFRAQAPVFEPGVGVVAISDPETERYGQWITITAGDGLAYWAFDTAEGRDAFLDDYPQATELAAEAVFGSPA